jgi:hypothetical protein
VAATVIQKQSYEAEKVVNWAPKAAKRRPWALLMLAKQFTKHPKTIHGTTEIYVFIRNSCQK